eukprot:TRINITY_DN1409_c0_g1_i1.p1 TRINITY_DN1409_c0_g1~~TRINITY_DN1409_c0_g1_i1.p1  ORF type:complete len:363 (+),score=98.51 TRINITY_DN1409_c0_g1_i1:80-1168(+)
MYKVTSQLNSSYGPDSLSGPEMPTVTVGDKRMTNVKMPNGDVIRGIRRNKDILEPSENVMSCDVPGLRPLRYTPGLNCDPHLESLRPERNSSHPALQGGDSWKKKLIQHPKTYEGSFVDANMQEFRPSPNVEDTWYTSRLPEGSAQGGLDRLAMPSGQQTYGPYDSVYPQDELSQIKMRNRRFQNTCAAPGPYGEPPMMRGQPMYGPVGPAAFMYPPYAAPMMMMPPPPMMGAYPGQMPPPQQMPQERSPLEDLSMLDQELNMTRRATRPFVPSEGPDMSRLQRHLDDLEQEQLKIHRKSSEPIQSVDQLPPPKKVVKAPLTEANAPKVRPEVRIADQIAIRSFVLGNHMKSEPKDKKAVLE